MTAVADYRGGRLNSLGGICMHSVKIPVVVLIGLILIGGKANSVCLSASYLPRELWVSAIPTESKGKGTQAAPFDAHSAERFQAIINEAPSGAVIHLMPGTYSKLNVAISKSVTISGGKGVTITQDTGPHKPIFAISGATTDFTLTEISLIHGTSFAEEQNVAAILGGCQKLTLRNVSSRDFNNTVYIIDRATYEVDIEDCQFEYTYGRASISNVAPYNHPCAAIAGNPRRLIVRNNRFNGLLDPTFSGVSPSAPESQRQPADNFVQTGDHSYCVVENNVIENFGIEGIFIARRNVDGDYQVNILSNQLTGAVYRNPIYSPVYAPGVKLFNSRGQIIGNQVSNTNIGISAEFAAYEEQQNIVNVAQNHINSCLLGIEGVKVSSKSLFSDNTVWNRSEPVRTIWGPKALATELYGIVTNSGRVIDNKLTADEPIWDAVTTLLSRSANVFTVSSTVGITAEGALISYADGWFAAFPVRGIDGHQITVDRGFAISYAYVRGGTLYYARSFANGLSNGGIVVRSGGTVFADHNFISGYRNDVSQQNSGFLVVTHQTVRDCRVTNTNTKASFLKP